MKAIIKYIKEICVGLWRLAQGMYITLLNFLRPKLTEQYPENRGEHVYFDRFRAMLTMPHDENNHHKCTACEICMKNCPNGTITVISRMEVNPETGKSKKVLDRYVYDVGSCIFCDLCTTTCPFGAIEFSNSFEHSLFTKERLVKQLNLPGSSLAPKPAPAPAAAKPAPAPAPAAKPASEEKPAAAAEKTEPAAEKPQPAPAPAEPAETAAPAPDTTTKTA